MPPATRRELRLSGINGVTSHHLAMEEMLETFEQCECRPCFVAALALGTSRCSDDSTLAHMLIALITSSYSTVKRKHIAQNRDIIKNNALAQLRIRELETRLHELEAERSDLAHERICMRAQAERYEHQLRCVQVGLQIAGQAIDNPQGVLELGKGLGLGAGLGSGVQSHRRGRGKRGVVQGQWQQLLPPHPSVAPSQRISLKDSRLPPGVVRSVACAPPARLHGLAEASGEEEVEEEPQESEDVQCGEDYQQEEGLEVWPAEAETDRSSSPSQWQQGAQGTYSDSDTPQELDEDATFFLSSSVPSEGPEAEEEEAEDEEFSEYQPREAPSEDDSAYVELGRGGQSFVERREGGAATPIPQRRMSSRRRSDPPSMEVVPLTSWSATTAATVKSLSQIPLQSSSSVQLALCSPQDLSVSNALELDGDLGPVSSSGFGTERDSVRERTLLGPELGISESVAADSADAARRRVGRQSGMLNGSGGGQAADRAASSAAAPALGVDGLRSGFSEDFTDDEQRFGSGDTISEMVPTSQGQADEEGEEEEAPRRRGRISGPAKKKARSKQQADGPGKTCTSVMKISQISCSHAPF